MQHVNEPMNRVVSIANSQTRATQSTTGEPDARSKQAAVIFFARLRTVYGNSKLKALFRTEDEFRHMRREWANRIAKLTDEQLDLVFERLKAALESGDPDYEWPDVGKILSLAYTSSGSGQTRAHQIYKPAALPAPPEERQRRRQAGLSHLDALLKTMGRRRREDRHEEATHTESAE